MAKNLKKIKKNSFKVKEGKENRSDLLHELRWRGGHICKNTEAWGKARDSLGINGLDPISRYDIESLTMNSHINSFILASLHNPGAKNLYLYAIPGRPQSCQE